MKTIGIFPASGGLGGSTYRHLLKLVQADKVILISRHPEKTPQEYIDAGVQTRQASYESSPSDLEAAFAGVDTLFLISYPSHVRDYRVKVQLPAVDAAHRAGVSHIFYSSLAFAGEATSNHSLAEVMQAHLATEAHLRQLANDGNSPLSYTILREGLYAESTPIYMAFFRPDQPPQQQQQPAEIRIPHDGSGPGIAWVARDELGEASARLIARYATTTTESDDDPAATTFPYINRTVLLTGTRVWSLADTVKVLAEIAGRRDLAIKQVSVDEYVQLPQVRAVFGPEEEKARTWATAWDAVRAGETAVVTGEMEEILGRRPEDFEVAARKYWAENAVPS
ncbi:uncharacterized protein B0T15DRAFT_190278 [Chaetomium strumarium]|uniref:NAD(P)-binding domain-containing protein n=1 Tax=Chaetomium strumarium TaxID=1170767 RepID=A0AAJ0M186_9PEZI|nr:hypothetical protein B0T15DRAFT_190278 [Chaetomium strumarium]